MGKHGYRGVDRGEEREKEKSIRSACSQEIECRGKLATRRIQGYPEKGSAASVAAGMFISASLSSYLSHSHIFILFLFSALAAHFVFLAVFLHQTHPCKQSSPPPSVPFPKKQNVRRPDSASHTRSLSQRSRKRPLFSSLTICTWSHFR